MVRKWLRLVLGVGLLAVVVSIAAKVVQARRRDGDWGAPDPGAWPPATPEAAQNGWPPPQPEVPPPAPAPPLVTESAAPVVKKAAPPAPPARKSASTRAAARKSSATTSGASKASSARTGTGDGGRTSRTAGKRRRSPSSDQWVEPVGSACPPSHPVKVKLTSRLFHLPGMAAYSRTNPDRCYVDGDAAAADGFTKAKR